MNSIIDWLKAQLAAQFREGKWLRACLFLWESFPIYCELKFSLAYLLVCEWEVIYAYAQGRFRKNAT